MEENIKRFKKLFIVLFIFVCLFTLTACNKTSSKTYTGLDETYKVEKKTAEAYEKLREDLAKATYYSFTEEPKIIEF